MKDDLANLVPKLIRAALTEDRKSVESLARLFIRKTKKVHPQVAQEVARILSDNASGASLLRSAGLEPIPDDPATRLSLLSYEEPVDCPPPVLPAKVEQDIGRFVGEWKARAKLIDNGLTPPTSLLLVGPPGVGKTYTASYVATAVGLPLVTLDLASTVSSYLGRTGANIKTAINYARRFPSVLLLDEFDAIAKTRHDERDLGELKRVVNVVLKELESWPPHGMLVAATNLPELLDTAVWRRFSYVLQIPLPSSRERCRLLDDRFGTVLDKNLVTALTCLTEGLSAADVCDLAERILRRNLVEQIDVVHAAADENQHLLSNASPNLRKQICRALKESLGGEASVRDIAGLLGLASSTVHYYLKE